MAETVTTITIPPHPGNAPTEPVNANTYQLWDVYLRRLTAHLGAQQAQAKQESEAKCSASSAAMAAANESLARAQTAMAQALATSGKFTEFVFPAQGRRELVWEYLKTMPQVTRDTENTLVQAAAKLVDEYLKQLPAPAPAPAPQSAAVPK